MSNGINQRQNEKNSILKLAAQRQIYKEAKKLNRVIVSCSVIIPFALSIISLFSSYESWKIYPKLISLASWFVALILGMKIKKDQEIAALIQQQFDVYVFSLKWDNKLFRKNKNVDFLISEKAARLLKKRTAQEEKLPNWYRKEVDNLQLEKAVKLCQEQNVNWDGKLRKSCGAISICVVITLLGIIIAIGIKQSNVLLVALSFGIPILQWEMKVLTSIKSDMERLNKLSETINGIETCKIDELLENQREIYEHRINCYLIDDKIYEILRKKLERINKDRINYEIRKNSKEML